MSLGLNGGTRRSVGSAKNVQRVQEHKTFENWILTSIYSHTHTSWESHWNHMNLSFLISKIEKITPTPRFVRSTKWHDERKFASIVCDAGILLMLVLLYPIQHNMHECADALCGVRAHGVRQHSKERYNNRESASKTVGFGVRQARNGMPGSCLQCYKVPPEEDSFNSPLPVWLFAMCIVLSKQYFHTISK